MSSMSKYLNEIILLVFKMLFISLNEYMNVFSFVLLFGILHSAMWFIIHAINALCFLSLLSKFAIMLFSDIIMFKFNSLYEMLILYD